MRATFVLLRLTILLSACAVVSQEDGARPTISSPSKVVLTTPSEIQDRALDIDEGQQNRRVDDPNDYFFSQLLPFDGIRPVYDPQFVEAADSPLQDDELVLGVAWDGEAKAYPITVLQFREMVNDELAGIPTLVTW